MSKTILVPGQPVGLAVSTSGTTATVTWSAPTVGTTGLTGYRVARDGVDSKGVGAWSTTDSATTRSQSFTDLVPGKAYHVTVAAVNASGAGPAATGSVTPTLHWTVPTVVDPPQGHPDSVSCPTATFCAAVDETGHVVTYNGSTWTAPVVAALDGLRSVSCSSATFCLAVSNGTGEAHRYDGMTWSTAVNIGIPAVAVSCVSPSFCVAVGVVTAAIYNGTSWSQGFSTDAGHSLVSVSCVSTYFCAAIDDGGAITLNGSQWSARSAIADANNLQSVSCRSTTFCLATGGVFDFGGDGSVSTFNGTTWSDAAEITETSSAFRSVSCPANSVTCYAVNNDDGVLTYTASVWSNQIAADSASFGDAFFTGYVAISCAGNGACTVIGTNGKATTYNGTTWTTPAIVDQSQGTPAISCALATFLRSAGLLRRRHHLQRHGVDQARQGRCPSPGRQHHPRYDRHLHLLRTELEVLRRCRHPRLRPDLQRHCLEQAGLHHRQLHRRHLLLVRDVLPGHRRRGTAEHLQRHQLEHARLGRYGKPVLGTVLHQPHLLHRD